MAWQAKLNQDVFKIGTTQMGFEIVYFDDADPATILHGPKTFVFDDTRALADLRREIIAEGQAARTLIAQITTVRQQFPVGTAVAIP